MLEPELGLRPAAALPDQVEALQLAQRLAQLLLAAGDAREQRQAEAAAEHRGGGQRVAALGGRAGRRARGSPSRPSAAPRPRRRGRSASRLGRGCSAPASTSERTSSSRKNGLPSACVEEARARGRAAAFPRRRARAAARAPRRPRAPPARSCAARCGQLPRGLLAHRPRGVVGLGPLRDHEQDGGVLGHGRAAARPAAARSGRPSGRPRARARPGPFAASRSSRWRDDLERAVLQRLGRELGEARARLRLGGQAEQRAEVRVVVVGARRRRAG